MGGAHAGGQGDGVVGGSGQDNDPVEGGFERVEDGLEIVAIDGAEVDGEEVDAVEGFGFRDELFGVRGGFAGAGSFEVFFEFLMVGEEGFEFLFDLGGGRIEEACDFLETLGFAGGESAGF